MDDSNQSAAGSAPQPACFRTVEDKAILEQTQKKMHLSMFLLVFGSSIITAALVAIPYPL